MITQKTNNFRIKRHEFPANNILGKITETLQQWHGDVAGSGLGYWTNIPIVETDDDDSFL